MREIEIEFGNDLYLVEYEIYWKLIGYTGIGSYEYHGAKEFDLGYPEYELESVEIFTAYDSEGDEIPLNENPELVKKWIDYISDGAEYDGED